MSEKIDATNVFLATVAHELKTPLTVIHGFSEMLLQQPDGDLEMRVMALEAIRRRAAELARIVDYLLLSTRIEAGRLSVVPEEVDLDEVAHERAVALLATGRKVDVEVAEDLPHAWVDPRAIRSVVDHLLDNAVKYSPAGGRVVLTISESGGRLLIEVSDEGIGMTQEQVARCFDRFWQAEQHDSRRFAGSGIGLYIVRSLVVAMGGELSVNSVLGVGTTFRVSTPVASMRETAAR